MDIETARAIVADNSRAPHMADWMIANRTLYDHWQKHPEQLGPVRSGGALTTDATRRKGTLADTVQDIRNITARLKRGTRDQGEPKRIRRLGPPGSLFSIESDTEGCWLVEHTQEPMELGEGGQTGERPPPAEPELMEAAGPRKMGPTMMGDRHAAIRAARDKGAAWAAKQNERARQRWGS